MLLYRRSKNSTKTNNSFCFERWMKRMEVVYAYTLNDNNIYTVVVENRDGELLHESIGFNCINCVSSFIIGLKRLYDLTEITG